MSEIQTVIVVLTLFCGLIYFKNPFNFQKEKILMPLLAAIVLLTIYQMTCSPASTNEKTVQESTHKLLFFYADWCHHCKQFKPVWKESESELENLNVEHQQLNGDNNKELVQKYKITGYPTVLLINNLNNENVEFEGPRTKEGLISFVKKNIGKKRVTFADNTKGPKEHRENKQNTQKQETQKQETPKKPAVISNGNSKNIIALFFADWCGHSKRIAPTWDDLTANDLKTNGIRSVKYNSDSDSEMMKKYGIKGFPTILMINENSNKFIRYNGDRSKESLLNFAKDNINSELTDAQILEIYQGG